MSHPQQPYGQPQQPPAYAPPPPPPGPVYGQPPVMKQPRKKGSPVVGCLALVVIALIGVVVALIFTLPNAGDDEPADQPPPASSDLSGYLAALAAIDPALTNVDEGTARSSADNICQELADGKEPEITARNAALRFGVGEQLGEQIVAATQEHVC